MNNASPTDALARARARRRQHGAAGAHLDGPVTVDSGTAARWEPVTISARAPGLDLMTWLTANADGVRELIARRGAVRLRGMLATSETFGDAVSLVADAPLLEYVNRSTPRSRVAGRVFTSTEYSRDRSIPMHSEQSYTTSWPRLVGFWCERPATRGGETPLAPTAEVLRELPEPLVARFDLHGVRYERWYQPRLDLPWQEAFQTDDPAEVHRVCAASSIDVLWTDDGALRTRQVAQATLTHPGTGERCWFNQAHLFHPAALPDQGRALRDTTAGRLPRNTHLGDGSPITAAEVDTVRQAFEKASWLAPWAPDDLLLVDNVAVAHGRRPYEGDRRILVAMAGSGTNPAAGSER